MKHEGVTRSALLYAAAVLMLLALIGAAVARFTQLGENVAFSLRANALGLRQRDRLLQLVNEETGVRAYVATGNPVFLDVYYRSLQHALADESFIASHSNELPRLRARIQASDAAAAAVQESLRQEIALVRSGHKADADRRLMYEKTLFDGLRATNRPVAASAEQAMNQSLGDALALARQTVRGAVAFAAFLVLSAAIFFILLRRERAARISAFNDPLTGVGNRRQASATLYRLIGSNPDQSVGVIYLDLDNFKKINDNHGHASGDGILREAAHRMRSELRRQDEVCRMGGDEFVCIIAPPVNPQILGALCKRLHDRVTRPYAVEGEDFVVGCSFGWSFSPDHGNDAEQLLARADRAMYQAKTRGGGVATASA